MRLSELNVLSEPITRDVPVISDPDTKAVVNFRVKYDDEVAVSVVMKSWRNDFSFVLPDERDMVADRCIDGITYNVNGSASAGVIPKHLLRMLAPKLALSPGWASLPDMVPIEGKDDMRVLVKNMNPVFYMVLVNGISELYGYTQEREEEEKNG
ncbi:MAG: hypothetical protein QXP01_00305 [Candidatus Hadarchaeum sp.]